MSFATASDVVDRWPEGVPVPDTERLEVWLTDAEAMLWASSPCDLEELATEDDTVRTLVVMLESRIVIRALSNPATARGIVREQVGDTSVSYVAETAGLGLTDADRLLLEEICGAAPAGALASLPLGRDGREGPPLWPPWENWQRNAEDDP